MKKFLVRKHKGFTLLEMSVVLFIISLLVLIILPNLASQRKHATGVHRSAMTSVVQTQIDLYHDEIGDSNVDYKTLQNADYLTADQVAKAEKENIKIVNDKAIEDHG
ncbi:competence type IV pilus major pilin ComGC [Paucilactobacillus nenjiangensis]|jgi:competence protein ComGC|uniref:Prepilin-type N-terminal cleavage/methylation domain-containing protein n=1 Tax=Paucilactobacillus nenjiangensis TaxID=1296540 RepID=A0A5P1X5Q1_9LACO|nr:prepilin-type N-terminal cleavage/methylation domain-containing protein [Paucilactobacillus nenjiangensis]QER67801.1 prepilin-type N-terminal cleavage/methylation domain-containing protein [Paucilactobacillus nenjiangensis]